MTSNLKEIIELIDSKGESEGQDHAMNSWKERIGVKEETKRIKIGDERRK
jgi:hypothetical protein